MQLSGVEANGEWPTKTPIVAAGLHTAMVHSPTALEKANVKQKDRSFRIAVGLGGLQGMFDVGSFLYLGVFSTDRSSLNCSC